MFVILNHVHHATAGLVVTNLEAIPQRPMQALRLDAWLFEATIEFLSKTGRDSRIQLAPLVKRKVKEL
jgi:hypothetical protein